MARTLTLLMLLLAGSGSTLASAGARGTTLVGSPTEVVGKIREVDLEQMRLVMEERRLEAWATSRQQLQGLAPGQTVRLRFQQQDGRQVIISVVPVAK